MRLLAFKAADTDTCKLHYVDSVSIIGCDGDTMVLLYNILSFYRVKGINIKTFEYSYNSCDKNGSTLIAFSRRITKSVKLGR